MQPATQLTQWLRQRRRAGASALFRSQDLRNLFPEHSDSAFWVILNRAVKRGQLERITRGIYRDPEIPDDSGRQLYHVAALLRPQHFNYLSLESVLSEAGWISQIPLNWITLVSTGRTSTIDCGRLGTIEYVHSQRDPNEIIKHLHYDPACHLYRATPELALEDMKRMRRPTLDLVAPEQEVDQ